MGLKLSNEAKPINQIRFGGLEYGDIFCCDLISLHLLMKCEISINDDDYEIAIDLQTGSRIFIEDDYEITKVFEKGTKLIIS